MSEESNGTVRGVRYPVSLPAEGAAASRSLDERVFVRFPGVYTLLAKHLMRLPPPTRVRRLVLARLVGRALAAANRRDFDVLLLGIDAEIEYRPSPDQLPPGMDPVVYGRTGYREVWQRMIDAFEDFRGEPEELLDLGGTFLLTSQYGGHGTGSGVPVSFPVFGLFRLRNGLVVWQKDFSVRSEALEAAALVESQK
jgi:ketosteroid isomerase-like protein